MDITRTLATTVICLALGSLAQAQGIPQVPPGTRPAPSPPGRGAGFSLSTPFGNALSNVFPAAGMTSPTAAIAGAATSSKPEIGIAEAAGTLTDPVDFIYLSKEYVFDLLVLASQLGIPGVRFNPDSLPVLREVGADGTPSRGNRASSRDTAQPARRGGSDMETEWVGGSTPSGRRTLRGAQFLAGQDNQERTVAAPAPGDSDRMLNAIAVTGNDELAKLLELAKELPEWQRVGRFPLQTTQKQKIDRAVASIYATAFRSLNPAGGAPQYNYYGGPTGPGGSNTWVDSGSAQEGGNRSPIQPAPGIPPQQYPQPQYQGLPPVDPQAMGEWYYFYQQALGWEQYVRNEVLIQKSGEQTTYDLDTGLGPQDFYLVPTQQQPNAPPSVIHYGTKETPVSPRLSTVKPSAIQAALDQMSHTMEELAAQNAKNDSNRSRSFVARLDERKERRSRYRDWLNDQTTEIRKMAEDYRRRLAGNELTIDGVQYLVSPKPLTNVPLGSRNIVTERLTPYDLLDSDGTLKKATEETVEQTP